MGVLLKQFIGGVCHLPLGSGRLRRVVQPHGQHHLRLPQRNSVHKGGLYFLRHHRIIILDQTYLGSHLQRHHAGQLQIVKLLLKTAATVGQVIGLLSVLGKPGPSGLLHCRGKLLLHSDLQLSLPRQDIHRKLL